MNSITKLMTFSFALFLSLNIVIAQGGESKEKHMNNPEARAEKHTQRMTENLSLTESQISQVAKINLAYAEKISATKAANPNKEEGRAAVKSIRTEHDNAIKAVLTPDQVSKFEAKKGHKGKRGKGRKGHAGNSAERAAHHTKKLTEKLSLNETQTAKIAAINLDFAKKREAIKATSKDREAGKEAMKTLRTEQDNSIKAILTADQVSTFEKEKEARRGHRGKRGKGRKGNAENSAERAAHHTERLTEKLSLDETQIAKVAAINLDFAKKKEAVKAANEDREAGKEAMKGLITEQRTAIKAVLNTEQLSTYESLKKDRPKKKNCKGCK